MENQNTAISMEKCIPIPLEEKQQLEERSDKTSLAKSVKMSKNFNVFFLQNKKNNFHYSYFSVNPSKD